MAENKIQLTKADRKKVCFRHQFLQGSWNYERMQNGGWCFAMIPAIKKLYTSKDDQIAALKRHLEFYNTHPYVSAPVIGVTLDPKKVAQIGSQISSALSVAHKHEIIHRDIKPQNIMVLPDGNIKVMDFGIARAKNSHLTQDNNVLGTAHYVSPEQTRGQDLGPTSDIYSLGVVMYECATGRVPF